MDAVTASMVGLHDIIDKHAASHPETLAALDDTQSCTYSELKDLSIRLAAVLSRSCGSYGTSVTNPEWSTHPQAPRPLALALPRGCLWYALCVACWRLGIPLTAVSDDLKDKAAERDRNARMARELRPFVLVMGDGDPEATLPGRPADCVVLRVRELLSLAKGVDCSNGSPLSSNGDRAAPSLASVLVYSYTGGTTKHSKCVVTTNAMAMWEMANYATVLRGSMTRADRVLQYSSVYWGASAFGQIDIALFTGACVVFTPAPKAVDGITAVILRHSVTVLGTVPSQLRGAFPGGPRTKPACLRVILTWGEKLPVKLSRPWKEHTTIIELLIASEYWLALYSHCNTWHDPADECDKHILEPLPGLDMLLLSEDRSPTREGEMGELFISGPTVSPGYVGADGCVGSGPENESAYVHIHGKLYYRTKDRLRLLPGGGLIYYGRGDSLAKRGGAWVDLEALESATAALPGVSVAALVAAEELHMFLVLEPPSQEQLFRILERVRKVAGSECRLHVRNEMPRHAATDKIDRKKLQQELLDISAVDKDHHLFLRRMQRRMLLSYCSWYLPVLVILSFPSFCLHPPLEAISIVALKLCLLPYFWAASLFTWLHPAREREYSLNNYGQPDMFFFSVALLPASCLGSMLAISVAVLARYRDSAVLQTAGLAALAVVLLAHGGAFAAVDSAWLQILSILGVHWTENDGLFPKRLETHQSVFVAAVFVAFIQPHRLRYLAGLPVACFIVLPKWLADEWIWRREHSFSRRVLTKICGASRPKWDASIPPDFERWNKEFGADTYPQSVVKLTVSHGGLGVTIDLLEEPQACVKPLESSGATNGSAAGCAGGSSAPRGPLASSLAVLTERSGGSADALASMDSLQAITLAELIRKDLGREVSVKDLLAQSDVDQLAAWLEAHPESCAQPDAAGSIDDDELPDADGLYRGYIMDFPRAPVDWLIRYPGPGHLDISALQRATNRLVERHDALRTIESPDDALRTAMDKVAGLWQLCATCLGSTSPLWRSVSNAVGGALFQCWPRTVLRPLSQAQINIKVPKGPRVRDAKWDFAAHDEYVFSAVKEQTYEPNPFRWPFDIVVVPMYKGEPAAPPEANAADIAVTLPPEDVSWYIYCSITHSYSDGACGQALFGDLLKYYEEETGQTARSPDPPVPQPLRLLQRRLRASLHGRLRGQSDPDNDVYHEVLDADFGQRDGFSRRVYLNAPLMRTLRLAATDVLGCSIDIAWVTAVTGAIFRLFPKMPCVHVILKVGCRDGPGERQMIGFLSEQRVLPVHVGDPSNATLLDITNIVASTRRRRAWRTLEPFEAGICIYVNIVSAMTDSLPQGYQHLPRPAATPLRWRGPAYCHLNVRIDQLATNSWDFRIFHWDAAWGWDWSTQFSHALGGVIHDMAAAPTAPLPIPPHVRQPREQNTWQPWGNKWGNKWKTKWEGGKWETRPCTHWAEHKCKYGDTCTFSHDGPGGPMPGLAQATSTWANSGWKRKEQDSADNDGAQTAEMSEPAAKVPRREEGVESLTASQEAAPNGSSTADSAGVSEPLAKAPRLDEGTSSSAMSLEVRAERGVPGDQEAFGDQRAPLEQGAVAGLEAAIADEESLLAGDGMEVEARVDEVSSPSV